MQKNTMTLKFDTYIYFIILLIIGFFSVKFKFFKTRAFYDSVNKSYDFLNDTYFSFMIHV